MRARDTIAESQQKPPQLLRRRGVTDAPSSGEEPSGVQGLLHGRHLLLVTGDEVGPCPAGEHYHDPLPSERLVGAKEDRMDPAGQAGPTVVDESDDDCVGVRGELAVIVSTAVEVGRPLEQRDDDDRPVLVLQGCRVLDGPRQPNQRPSRHERGRTGGRRVHAAASRGAENLRPSGHTHAPYREVRRCQRSDGRRAPVRLR